MLLRYEVVLTYRYGEYRKSPRLFDLTRDTHYIIPLDAASLLAHYSLKQAD